MKVVRLLVLAIVASMAGSVSAQGPQPEFSPRNGLGGRSEGNGTLQLFLCKPRPYHVESRGYDLQDGTFRLDQTVMMQGKQPRTRCWNIRTVGPHRYAGTLSDAAGPVTARSDGNCLFLRYRLRGPLVMHQTLRRMPDGRTIANTGRITLLGIPVGRLQETIIRKN